MQRLAEQARRTDQNSRGAGIIDALTDMPDRRHVVLLQEGLEAVAALGLDRLHVAVAQLQHREGGTSVGQDQDVVLQQDIRHVHNAALIDCLRIGAADQVDDAADLPAPEGICQRLEGSAQILCHALHAEAEFCLDLIGRDELWNSLAGLIALDGPFDNLTCNRGGLADVGMGVIIGDVFGTGQLGRILGCDHGGLEAVGCIHDGRIDILNIRHPQIQRAGAENQFGSGRIAERNDIVVAVHG